MSDDIQDGEPEGGECGQAGERCEVLEEDLGQHHGRPQLGLLSPLVPFPNLQQFPQHREQNSQECKLPLRGRQDLEVRQQETSLQESEGLGPHLLAGVAAEPGHALQGGAPGHLPQLPGLPGPGRLHPQRPGQQHVHQVQQLEGDVSVLTDKLLVTALVCLIPQHHISYSLM